MVMIAIIINRTLLRMAMMMDMKRISDQRLICSLAYLCALPTARHNPDSIRALLHCDCVNLESRSCRINDPHISCACFAVRDRVTRGVVHAAATEVLSVNWTVMHGLIVVHTQRLPASCS